MKISSKTLVALLVTEASLTGAFAPSTSFARSSQLKMGGEFDHILGEGAEPAVLKNVKSAIDTNNIIRLPDSSAAATLTSSISYEEVLAGETSTSEDIGGDMFGDGMEQGAPTGETRDPRIAEIIRKEQEQIAMKSQPVSKPPLSIRTMNYLKGKDFGEIFFTVLVPVIGGGYFLSKAYEQANVKVGEKAEDTLDDYANEMIYHDGDFEEMKMAHADYSKRLMFLGPKKTDAMIKRYLEFYAKKKTVSPQSISSLSYSFSIYKLTEEKAAETLSELCLSMPEKIASAGKLYFFGTHILKSPEAKAKLQPIFQLLSAQYFDDGVISGEEIVEKSQIAMGEAAYRAAVASAGKGQTKLTIGWEVLGLDEETATTIFEEVSGEGFLTQTQAKYGASQQKYDSKGRKVSKDDELENPEEADDEEDEDNSMTASGNVQECTECGFTLFVAEGRDFKFFNAGFTCPECGAAKSKFKAANLDA
jgi:rubrerythrin